MPQPQQNNRPAYNQDRDDTIALLQTCAGTLRRGNQMVKQWAGTCKAAAEKAARNGWIPQLPAAMLELRGMPPVDPDGNDQAREMAARLAGYGYRQPAGTTAGYECVSERTCDRRELTNQEFGNTRHPMNGIDQPRLPTQTPKRGIPYDRGAATIYGFTDATMNPDRYTLDRPNGSRMSSQETAAEMRRQKPEATVRAEVEQCLRNMAGDLASCMKAGVRWGMGNNADNNIVYDGSRFRGARQQNASK